MKYMVKAAAVAVSLGIALSPIASADNTSGTGHLNNTGTSGQLPPKPPPNAAVAKVVNKIRACFHLPPI